jgi:outer membrane lipase/esterase
VGQNDVLEQYARYPAATEQQIRDELASRGRALADQVNRLANANGRIVVLTINNMGESPFGQAQKSANTDTDRAALLSRMSEAFNTAMRLRLLNDGRLIGLVLSDEAVSQAYRFPSSFGLANVTSAACNVALPACTVDTLVTNANASSWLFADATRLGPSGHRRLSDAAITRAINNPF